MNPISVNSLSVRFTLELSNSRTLKETIVKLFKNQLEFKQFYALKDVSFSIKKGTTTGIIGKNGAGKSTLLKVIAGVLQPTKGNINVNGLIAPLIELGAGFDPELSGRENIMLNGLLLGLTKKYILSKMDEIIEFSELEEFINSSVKNYSSGMLARLGFAIASCVNPDILLVDETLSVGDFEFQKKCLNRIQKIKDSGSTIILVSHSTDQIKEMCSEVIWLEHGHLKEIGTPETIIPRYLIS